MPIYFLYVILARNNYEKFICNNHNVVFVSVNSFSQNEKSFL